MTDLSKEKLRIIHVLNDLSFSGAEVMLRSAAELFLKNDLDIYILSAEDNRREFADILAKSGYKVIAIPFSKSYKFCKSVYNLFKREKIDIVHIHTERVFFLYVVIAKIAGVKYTIRTVHNIFPFKGKSRLKRFVERFLARTLFKVQFISISDSVAEVERKVYNNKSIIVENWIDRKKFIPVKSHDEKIDLRKEFDIPNDAIVLISVGRCVAAKNHKAIMDAISMIKKRTDQSILYIHVGNGEMHKEEEDYVRQLGIVDKVRFFGEVKYVRKLLVSSDIFVMPSLFEGLGNSLFEAMSCGLPSVVYNVHGLRDLLKDGENGYLVDCSVEALANGLLKLIDNENLRVTMGAKAREIVEIEYNTEKSIGKLIDLYRDGTLNSKKSLDVDYANYSV